MPIGTLSKVDQNLRKRDFYSWAVSELPNNPVEGKDLEMHCSDLAMIFMASAGPTPTAEPNSF